MILSTSLPRDKQGMYDTLIRPGPPRVLTPLTTDERSARASTWYFSFDLDISFIQCLGITVLNPAHPTLKAAAIISYALSSPMPGSSLTKVTGFIAGRPEASLRRSTVQTWLVHNAVRNLQLTRITGERRNHTLIQEFLSIPAAGVSACAQAAQLQPATPFYNLRVDLLGASDTARNLGGRPRKVQPAAAPQPAVAVVQTPLSPSAQGGAGVPPWPQPSAPNVQDGLFGGLPAAEMGRRDPTDGF